MSTDQYLRNILHKYANDDAGAKAIASEVYPYIKTWAGKYLMEVIYSGSISKGTAISLSSDADLFISLSSTANSNLKQIYESLYNTFRERGFQIRKQNVSIRVTTKGFDIDLVPGRRQSQYGYDHSLYRKKQDTWTKANVKTHVSLVSGSGRVDEIKLVKIWRELHRVEFPSFYLELVVLDALHNRSIGDIGNNFFNVLTFLAGDFLNKVYMDPANTNNVVSNDLTRAEKQVVQRTAQVSIAKNNWNQIVW